MNAAKFVPFWRKNDSSTSRTERRRELPMYVLTAVASDSYDEVASTLSHSSQSEKTPSWDFTNGDNLLSGYLGLSLLHVHVTEFTRVTEFETPWLEFRGNALRATTATRDALCCVDKTKDGYATGTYCGLEIRAGDSLLTFAERHNKHGALRAIREFAQRSTSTDCRAG